MGDLPDGGPPVSDEAGLRAFRPTGDVPSHRVEALSWPFSEGIASMGDLPDGGPPVSDEAGLRAFRPTGDVPSYGVEESEESGLEMDE
jgi:hypothetical protein